MRLWLIIFCGGLIVASGCQEGASTGHNAGQKKSAEEVMAGYAPRSIEVLALSTLKPNSQNQGVPQLKLFVAMQDSFGSAMKYPGVFRFELYEYTAKSPLPKGRRLEKWPDFDLTDATVNSVQYKDYLRAYEFELDVQPGLEVGRTYIVEATCVLPSGRRVNSQAHITMSGG